MNWETVEADVAKILPHHFTAGRDSIRGITIHHMAGNLSIEDCYNVWLNREASAHYAVQADGKVGQIVWDRDTAWACGHTWANRNTISIEHANDGSNPWTVHPAALDSGAHLVAALCRFYELGEPAWMVNVFPHSHWSATACPGELAGSQNAEYMTKAKAYYAEMMGGTPAPSAPAIEPEPAAPVAPAGKVDVRYALRTMNGAWLPEVTNFDNVSADGFAGIPNVAHDYLYVKVDRGSVKYRVHTAQSGWLPWVVKGDKNDLVNGCAGIGGQAIDGVQIYYYTPEGEAYQQAWYRSQTTHRAGWLAVCCDDGTSVDGYDGWAGMMGEPLDRLQIAITDSNPF